MRNTPSPHSPETPTVISNYPASFPSPCRSNPDPPTKDMLQGFLSNSAYNRLGRVSLWTISGQTRLEGLLGQWLSNSLQDREQL